ncbi:MAG: hypothetical protein K8U57_00060 [Planctomycetes bacterium]|nr:hypothetical protein [Planctomycetota bacterium]
MSDSLTQATRFAANNVANLTTKLLTAATTPGTETTTQARALVELLAMGEKLQELLRVVQKNEPLRV